MALRLAVLKNVFDSYNGKAYPLIFLFTALIYFILREKKEQRSLLIYEIFGILLLVTPFIGNKIITLGAGKESNWPVYGILCMIPVTGYIAAELFHERKGKKEQYRFLIVFFIVIQLGLGFSVTGEPFILPKNLQKTSASVSEIAKTLEADTEWYVMAPEQIAGELREYDSSIRVFFDDSYALMQEDVNLLQSEAAFNGCNCVILEKEYDDEEAMLAGGFTKLADIEEYIIYIKRYS